MTNYSFIDGGGSRVDRQNNQNNTFVCKQKDMLLFSERKTNNGVSKWQRLITTNISDREIKFNKEMRKENFLDWY